MTGVPEVYLESSFHGHKVSPGVYTLLLKVGKFESKTVCKILPNPRYDISPEAYLEYHTFMMAMEETLNDMHGKVNKIQKMQKQIEEVLKDFPEGEKYTALKKAGKDLVKKMKAWDDDMVQRKAKAYDDVDNYENKFTANFMFLINHSESDIPKVTKPNRDRLAELALEWNKLNVRASELIEKEVPAYSKLLWEIGIGAVRVP
jgi:hypothetical protein